MARPRTFPHSTPPSYLGDLTPRELIFCREYVANGKVDVVAAFVAAFPGTAGVLDDDELRRRAKSLLRRPAIANQVDRQTRDACAALDISPERVLARWALLAFADPRELIRHRRVNCRHCWGADHRYQHSPAEWAQKLAVALSAAVKSGTEYEELDPEGGDGWRANRPPHPECPECCGEGVPDIIVADTDHLSPAAAALFAGIKSTPHGYEIRLADQVKALEALSKFLGITPETVRILSQPLTATADDYSDPERAAETYRRLMDG